MRGIALLTRFTANWKGLFNPCGWQKKDTALPYPNPVSPEQVTEV
jgi:hypothetical protein